MRCGQIVYSIEDADRCDEKLSWEDMVRIKSVLLARKTATEFPMPLDSHARHSQLPSWVPAVAAVISGLAIDAGGLFLHAKKG